MTGEQMTGDQAPIDFIRVMVVDDHAIVRRGLRAHVDTVATLKVVGEAADGQQAIAQVPAVGLTSLIARER